MLSSRTTHHVQINLLDGDGQSALHHAAKGGHVNMCRLLMAQKIDTFVISSDGQTASDIASSSNVQELFRSTFEERSLLVQAEPLL